MNFITISRKLGTDGTEIARQVADRLGYRLIDRDAIDFAAKEMGFLESVEKVDEKRPSLFQRIFSHEPAINLDRLNSVIHELGQKGDAVFLGRGGHILLQDFGCALHVSITASRTTRIRNLVERGYVEEAAEKAVEQSDRDRGGFMRFAFGVDWEDPNLYDIVLNMDKLSINLAVETILTLAKSEDIKVCSLDSLESLGKIALADRAEAAIIEAGLSYGQATSVSVAVEESGTVRLTGLVEDENSKSRAEEVVKAVKGVETVENLIRVRPRSRHA